jgi:hypothetical protein
MGEPTWSEIKKLNVPDKAGSVWTQALDWVTAGKLYRVEVRPISVHAERKTTHRQRTEDTKSANNTSEKDLRKDKASVPVGTPEKKAAAHEPASAQSAGTTGAKAIPASAAPPPTGGGTQTDAPKTDLTKQPVSEREDGNGRAEHQTDDESDSNGDNLEEQSWTPVGSNRSCTADGDLSGLSRRDPLIVAGARLGTLICKIGGSTADLTLDPTALPVFPVGRFCVFKAPDETKTGPMFLGINDSPAAAAQVQGSLEVVISVAL